MGGLCLPFTLYKDNSQGLTLHPCHFWYLFRNLYRQKQSLQVMNFFPTLKSCPMSPGSLSLSLLPKRFHMSLLWGELKFPNKFSFACICWLIIRALFHFVFLGMSVLQVMKSMADPFTLKAIVVGKKRGKMKELNPSDFCLFVCFVTRFYFTTFVLLDLPHISPFLSSTMRRLGLKNYQNINRSHNSIYHIIIYCFKMCMLFKKIYSLW